MGSVTSVMLDDVYEDVKELGNECARAIGLHFKSKSAV